MKFASNENFFNQTARQALAALALTAMFAVPLTASAQKMKSPPTKTKQAAAASKKLTEEQKILHVLNRLGYGARPGEAEQMRQIGLDKYIEQQLNPEKIDDAAAEAKVKNLEVLKLSNAELFARYPNPGAVLQIVARNNDLNAKQLRGDLKADRKATKNGVEQKQTTPNEAMSGNQNQAVAAPNLDQLSDEQRREYQRQAAAVYAKYNLRRPAQITQQLNASRILRAVYSQRQLQEQMVDFWSNHFNVYAGKAAVRWYLPEYDRDVVRPNALGNFRDLLVATAKSPAMLFYLDNFQSVAENNNQNRRRDQRLERIERNGGRIPPQMMERLRRQYPNATDQEIEQRIKTMTSRQQNQQRRGINENYARELMELHTLGVEGGYTQKDIQEIARAFTGWTIIDARGYRRAGKDLLNEKDNRALDGLQKMVGLPVDADSGTFYFNERQHDKGEKTVLGQKIPAGGGIEDGLRVIDILVKHPSTAKFIARKLAVKFVNDNPSEALVNRVADAFQKSNGDIKTTLRAVFSSPEFFAPENYRAKIKTPFEVLVSGIRALGAETNASPALQAMLLKMGEPLYGYIAPTGYPDKAEDWVNTGALLERLNYGLALAANRIPGTRVDLTKIVGRDPDNKEKVLDTFVSAVLHDEVSPATKATLLKQLNQPLPEPKLDAMKDDDDEAMMENASMPRGNRRNGGANQVRLLPASGNAEVVKILGLVLGSPEFQRQ